MPDRELVPTQSAFLELTAERAGMREGYRFLDEKRLILASEILANLDAYDAAKAQWSRAQDDALAALRGAAGRHGLEELSVYPASRGRCELRTTVRSVLGVRIQDPPPAREPASTPVSGRAPAPAPRVSGSAKGLEPDETTGVAADSPGTSDTPGATSTDLQTPEAEQCRARFDALLPIAARLAVLTGNLERLRREYVRTARRARALEDVLLPEIDARLDGIETALEELEREESVRVRRVVR